MTDRTILDDWVYAEKRLLTTFEPELQEQHARAQLARSLNSRRLVAVIGSGMSIGYGQPTWRQLLIATARYLDRLWAKVQKGDVEVLPVLKEVRATFVRFDISGTAKGLDADAIPSAFEVCENFYVAMHGAQRKPSGVEKAEVIWRREAKRAFRNRLRWQLKDGRGNAELFIDDQIARRDGTFEDGEKEALVEIRDLLAPPEPLKARGQEEDHFAARFAALFYADTIVPREGDSAVVSGRTELARLLKDGHGNSSLEAAVKARLLEADGTERRDGPDERHLLEAGFALLSNADFVEAIGKIRRAADLPTAPTQRSRFVPRHRDPLAVLFDDLKITRFLTTNYDDEIDRFLEARGYRQMGDRFNEDPPTPDAVAYHSKTRFIDSSSNRADVLAYEPGAAAYLFDYGADTRDHRIQSLHIHGRIRSPNSWLVLGERDYRERYARDDDPRAKSDDAMRLLFTANPLLFLGLGMREPDILRPLRAFSDDVSRLCDRPAVALLPRESDETQRQRTMVETLSRYGVYLLQYGAATPIGEEEDPDFMSGMLNAQRALLAVVNKAPGHKTDIQSLCTAIQQAFRPIAAVEGGQIGLYAVQRLQQELKSITTVLGAGTASDRVRDAVRLILEGVGSDIRTTFMTAWLRRMVKEWAVWLDSWSRIPEPREYGGLNQSPLWREGVGHLAASRHRTLLRNLEEEDREEGGPSRSPPTDRFFAGAPSPAFQVLRASLANPSSPDLSGHPVGNPGAGRRALYLLSDRGAGRGHIFSAMRSPRRFAHLCQWLGLVDEIPRSERPLSDDEAHALTQGIHSAFFNLGMSHEVISIFDRLSFFLETMAGRVLDDRARESFDLRCLSLINDRVGRLRFVLGELARQGRAGGRRRGHRAIVVFNHYGIFLDAQGHPKNAQIGRLTSALIDPAFKDAPIDFIFMMKANQLPASVREEAAKAAEAAKVGEGNLPGQPGLGVRLLAPQGLEQDARRRLHQRYVEALGVKPGDGEGAESRTFVHFLQAMRPITLATRFFPRAAVALAHLGGQKTGWCDGKQIVHFNDPGGPNDRKGTPLGLGSAKVVQEFQTELRRTFEVQLADPGSYEEIQALGAAFAGDDIEAIMLGALEAQIGQATGNGRTPFAHVEMQLKAVREGKFLRSTESGGRFWFEKIARMVGHNRYAMTLVLAAIDDMISRRLPDDPKNLVNLTAIESFIERLRLATSGRDPLTREDIVVAEVLRLYQTDTMSSYGKPLALWPWTPPAPFDLVGTSADKRHDQQAKAYALSECILVALALIGQPVEAAVLTGIQSVRVALLDLCKALGLDDDDPNSTRACLQLALDVLVHRCLAFRVAPKGNEKGGSDYQGHRFATHKAMRRHYYRQFNAPLVDYAEVDQLTVSIYVTQPGDLPRPSAEGHRRVRALIDELSGFEEPTFHPAKGDPFAPPKATPGKDPLDNEEWRRISRARLRAAYGALRSIYSIGVLSRFSTYESEEIAPPENGYLENHRLRCRWMLRMAGVLDKPGQDSAVAAHREATRSADKYSCRVSKELFTLHAEEIVWLFNECGVLSLAQGRLNDAASLLAQARKAARDRLEHGEWGGLHARIGVNRAVVDIERGRLRDAEHLLRRVLQDPDENRALKACARGYVAFIGDLRGDAPSAMKALGQVVDELVELKRYRSAAIFSIHLADCARSQGRHQFDLADQAADRACGYAVKGGHEDIRQVGQLSRVWLRINGEGGDSDKKRIDADLAEIEVYARVMGMPRLKCRVAQVRAQYLLNQSDYRAAAESAQLALQIATQHDMELRKISALSLLGGAMLKLEAIEARTLLNRARELAQHAEFYAEINRIEALLSME